jgi:hypothetical protein
MKFNLFSWIKATGLLLLNIFGKYVWIKLLFLIIAIVDNFIIQKKLDFDSYRTICLGIAIFMALDTTYIVDNKEARFWSKEFGVFKLKQKKEEGDGE